MKFPSVCGRTLCSGRGSSYIIRQTNGVVVVIGRKSNNSEFYSVSKIFHEEDEEFIRKDGQKLYAKDAVWQRKN